MYSWADNDSSASAFQEAPQIARHLSTNEHERDDRTKRLIASIRWSATFIVTYEWALIVVVLIFAAFHQYGRLSKAGRRRGEEKTQEIKSDTSTSSTERSTLLSSRRLKQQNGLVKNITSSIRACLIYQPPPIPIINKSPSDNGTTLLILSLLGLNLFYCFYKITFDLDQIIVLGDRLALLFVANLPWLYILGAKNQPIKLLTGHSYENLNILHRRLGEWMCLLALLHTIASFSLWYSFFRLAGMTLQHYLSRRIIYMGLLTFLCYESLYLTSLSTFRRWWYEAFLASHIFLQVAALACLYFHHHGSRPYVLAALLIFLLDRLIFRLGVKTRSFRADLSILSDGETVLVSANWPVVSRWRNLLSSLLPSNLHYGWHPTEHVFLSVPSLSHKHTFQAHPFTIASAAPSTSSISNISSSDETPHAWLSLLIRAHDGFTADLLQYAQTHSSTTIRLDGPYGSLHALEMLKRSTISVILAGGSGIAVAYPLLWALLHDKAPKHEDMEAAVSLSQQQSKQRQITLIWVVHEAEHVEWIGQHRLDELRELGLRVVMPLPTAKAGRPDVGALVREAVRESASCASEAGHGDDRVGVVVSGPDGMNRAARNACASMAWRGLDVSVATEKFAW